VKRITKAALGGIAGGALILAGTLAGTMAAGASTTYRYVDKLGDFSAAEGPFDSTTGKVTIVENDNGTTTFTIKITGIDISVADDEFGAHLHVGPCVDGDYANPSINKNAGSLAGPHYNADIAAGVPAAEVEISPKTEVWFDLIPSEEDGAASDRVTVPFVPVDDGVMSIVIHAEDTNTDTGGAGVRQACFPLVVPEDWSSAQPLTA
jgi:Cu/Zn superoxide dismutase